MNTGRMGLHSSSVWHPAAVRINQTVQPLLRKSQDHLGFSRQQDMLNLAKKVENNENLL